MAKNFKVADLVIAAVIRVIEVTVFAIVAVLSLTFFNSLDWNQYVSMVAAGLIGYFAAAASVFGIWYCWSWRFRL